MGREPISIAALRRMLAAGTPSLHCGAVAYDALPALLDVVEAARLIANHGIGCARVCLDHDGAPLYIDDVLMFHENESCSCGLDALRTALSLVTP